MPPRRGRSKKVAPTPPPHPSLPQPDEMFIATPGFTPTSTGRIGSADNLPAPLVHMAGSGMADHADKENMADRIKQKGRRATKLSSSITSPKKTPKSEPQFQSLGDSTASKLNSHAPETPMISRPSTPRKREPPKFSMALPPAKRLRSANEVSDLSVYRPYEDRRGNLASLVFSQSMGMTLPKAEISMKPRTMTLPQLVPDSSHLRSLRPASVPCDKPSATAPADGISNRGTLPSGIATNHVAGREACGDGVSNEPILVKKSLNDEQLLDDRNVDSVPTNAVSDPAGDTITNPGPTDSISIHVDATSNVPDDGLLRESLRPRGVSKGSISASDIPASFSPGSGPSTGGSSEGGFSASNQSVAKVTAIASPIGNRPGTDASTSNALVGGASSSRAVREGVPEPLAQARGIPVARNHVYERSTLPLNAVTTLKHEDLEPSRQGSFSQQVPRSRMVEDLINRRASNPSYPAAESRQSIHPVETGPRDTPSRRPAWKIYYPQKKLPSSYPDPDLQPLGFGVRVDMERPSTSSLDSFQSVYSQTTAPATSVALARNSSSTVPGRCSSFGMPGRTSQLDDPRHAVVDPPLPSRNQSSGLQAEDEGQPQSHSQRQIKEAMGQSYSKQTPAFPVQASREAVELHSLSATTNPAGVRQTPPPNTQPTSATGSPFINFTPDDVAQSANTARKRRPESSSKLLPRADNIDQVISETPQCKRRKHSGLIEEASHDTSPSAALDGRTMSDEEFIAAMKVSLDRQRKQKRRIFGRRQADRIYQVLDVANPPGGAEALFLSAEEATKHLEPNSYFSGIIITDGLQPRALQTTIEFLEEYYDDDAKVFIQDAAVECTEKNPPAPREVTIGQLKKRFLETPKSKKSIPPWNCLELATHVEDGLRPAFLGGEDCCLLTKLKHPNSGDKAGRRGYDPGWKEVEKWALLAQGGALTEPHQDSHGYNTYITVNQGIIGFGWLANPSQEERDAWREEPQSFKGGNWCYVILRPGQTVYFPSGTVHFVFRLAAVGDTLAFGGHVLRCSQIVRWMETLLEEQKDPEITNEDLTVSAPAYMDRVEKFVRQALFKGRVDIWGGEESIARFLELKDKFMKKNEVIKKTSKTKK